MIVPRDWQMSVTATRNNTSTLNGLQIRTKREHNVRSKTTSNAAPHTLLEQRLVLPCKPMASARSSSHVRLQFQIAVIGRASQNLLSWRHQLPSSSVWRRRTPGTFKKQRHRHSTSSTMTNTTTAQCKEKCLHYMEFDFRPIKLSPYSCSDLQRFEN